MQKGKGMDKVGWKRVLTFLRNTTAEPISFPAVSASRKEGVVNDSSCLRYLWSNCKTDPATAVQNRFLVRRVRYWWSPLCCRRSYTGDDRKSIAYMVYGLAIIPQLFNVYISEQLREVWDCYIFWIEKTPQFLCWSNWMSILLWHIRCLV